MFEPQTRAALTDQLRPPAGFELSHAVGTTFTLDLETALSIPLSFAAHRVSTADGDLGVLDALRRATDRVDIFAQAGELSMGRRSDLVAFLETIVHPVTHARGLFHPKVWFLEYQSGNELSYRFICASRNLTSDRSWDVVVRLDGVLIADERREEVAEHNESLTRLLRSLPGRAVQPVAANRIERIERFADHLRHVEWERPGGIHDLKFHVFGDPDQRPFDVRGTRALVISPFLSDDGVRTLRSHRKTETHLVSRAESLDQLASSTLDDKLKTYVLDDAASFSSYEAESEAIPAEIGTQDSTPPASQETLVGLHAKAIVVDRAYDAHVFLGSANATGAALGSNVEVMVELVGKQSQFGVWKTLEALGTLIEPYEPKPIEPDPDDEAQRELESYLRKLAAIRLTARISSDPAYGLSVWAEEPVVTRDGILLRWELLTTRLFGSDRLPSGEADAVRLEGLDLTQLSPFIVLIASDTAGHERRTIVLAQLLDDVDSRRDAIIANQLNGDPQAFVRLLTLMLELAGLSGASGSGGAGYFGSQSGSDGSTGGLFEALVRAVGAGSAGLEDAKRLIDILAADEATRRALPEGFEALWAAVWSAHESVLTTTVRIAKGSIA